MSDYHLQINRLIQQATGESDADTALLEEAARLADLHQDVSLGVEARIHLVTAANFSGNYETCLAAFTWCMAQMDCNLLVRARWEHVILWYYKWIINSLSDYPEVTRQQLEQGLADMTKRYQQAGYPLGAIHKCRMDVALSLGDLETWMQARKDWLAAPAHKIDDCPACQTEGEVRFHLEAGELETAVNVAEPIIAGRQHCKSVPCTTFSRLLLPLLELGRPEQAKDFHTRSIRQAMSSRRYLDLAGFHCAYLALTGQTSRAIRIFEDGISWTMVQKRAWEPMHFLECAQVLFEMLSRSGDQPVSTKIPESAPFHRSDGVYTPSVVQRSLIQMHSALVEQYNRRNGNRYFSARHERFQKSVETILAGAAS